MDIKWVGAHINNYTVGRGGKKINKIVLHWIVGTLESADATFANPDRKATAHYGIGGTSVHQYVKEEDTAWHSSNWTTNQESIGIEHEGGWLLADGTRSKPSDATHKTSALLVNDICNRYGLPIDRNTIHVHNEYSATTCPGTLDVDRIIEMAKSIVPPLPDPQTITNLQTRISLGVPWGIQELQAIISTLNDQKRDLDAKQRQIDALNLKILEAENANITEISKINADWQSLLEVANSKFAACEAHKAENMTYSELFSIAWKKFWAIKKGGV